MASGLTVAREDFVAGVEEHENQLEVALTAARSSVALAVPFVPDLDTFEQLFGKVRRAVERGVRVDLLVGRVGTGLDVRELTDRVAAAAYGSDNQSGRSLFRTRSLVTGSGASILIYDTELGALAAVLGDHDWLAGHAGSLQPLSLRISEPRLSADLARAVGSL